MAGAITTNDVTTAKAELARMRGALKRWLKWRATNDAVLSGNAGALKKPLAYAQRTIAARRDPRLEQDLADKLHALLSSMFPDAQLPSADVSTNPSAAVQLATIAVTGNVPTSSPAAVSGVGLTHPWLWPVLIVGGILLAITTAIKSAADLAAQKEQDACIEAGACTDYGFWLKAGGVTVIGWFAWKELGVGDIVKKLLKGRG